MAAIFMGRADIPDPEAARQGGIWTRAAFTGTAVRRAAGDLVALAGLAYGHMLESARMRRDARRLAQLDDRMLRDIGLSRADIASAVNGQAVYAQPRAEGRCDDQP